MLMDNSHCSKCHKPIIASQGPYCVDCSNMILEEYEITIVTSDGGELVIGQASDDETSRVVKQYVLNVHKRMRDAKLSHLN